MLYLSNYYCHYATHRAIGYPRWPCDNDEERFYLRNMTLNDAKAKTITSVTCLNPSSTLYKLGSLSL